MGNIGQDSLLNFQKLHGATQGRRNKTTESWGKQVGEVATILEELTAEIRKEDAELRKRFSLLQLLSP